MGDLARGSPHKRYGQYYYPCRNRHGGIHHAEFNVTTISLETIDLWPFNNHVKWPFFVNRRARYISIFEKIEMRYCTAALWLHSVLVPA